MRNGRSNVRTQEGFSGEVIFELHLEGRGGMGPEDKTERNTPYGGGKRQKPWGVGTSGSLENMKVLEGRRGLACAPLGFLSEAGAMFC